MFSESTGAGAAAPEGPADDIALTTLDGHLATHNPLATTLTTRFCVR